MRFEWSVETRARAIELRLSGWLLWKISNEIGCSRSMLGHFLKKHNVSAPEEFRRAKTSTMSQRKHIIWLHFHEKLSYAKIAREIELTQSAVRYVCEMQESRTPTVRDHRQAQRRCLGPGAKDEGCGKMLDSKWIGHRLCRNCADIVSGMAA